MASATTMWRPPRHKDIPQEIGAFYAELVARILESETNGRFGWDVVNKKLGLGVEVKARDNNHPFGVNVRQKKRHERSNQKHQLYCFCSYRKQQRIPKGAKKPKRTDGKQMKKKQLDLLASGAPAVQTSALQLYSQEDR